MKVEGMLFTTIQNKKDCKKNTMNNCTPKLDILDEMDIFLKTQKLPTLTQEEIEKLTVL